MLRAVADLRLDRADRRWLALRRALPTLDGRLLSWADGGDRRRADADAGLLPARLDVRPGHLRGREPVRFRRLRLGLRRVRGPRRGRGDAAAALRRRWWVRRRDSAAAARRRRAGQLQC